MSNARVIHYWQKVGLSVLKNNIRYFPYYYFLFYILNIFMSVRIHDVSLLQQHTWSLFLGFPHTIFPYIIETIWWFTIFCRKLNRLVFYFMKGRYTILNRIWKFGVKSAFLLPSLRKQLPPQRRHVYPQWTNMESLKTDPQYRRNIIPICVMLFTFGFAYSVGSYSYGEYGHEAFHYRSDHSNRSLCDTNTSSEEYRQEQIVQSKVSKWSTYMSLSQGIPLLISAGLFSSLSDSKGRKPLILVSLIGVFLKTLLMSIAVACKWNVYVFLVFIFIDGCCGSWVTQLSISMAMVSDLTSVGKSRSFLIAFVGFMVSLGYACGSFSSGFIIKKLGYSWSLGISSIVCVMTMGILYFVQETLQEHKRIRLDCNIKSYLKNLVQFYVDDDPINQHSSKWKYVLCLSALVCTLLPRLGSFSVEIYYIMNSPFCFTPVTIGIFQTSKSIGSDCVILVGIKIMQYKLSDEMISLVGTLSAIVSFIMIGFAKSTNFMIIGEIYTFDMKYMYFECESLTC